MSSGCSEGQYAFVAGRRVNGGNSLAEKAGTRERILATARDLFNAEGAGGQSALDIATALGISAGHLYYHFKGKPQIVAELMDAHAGEVAMVLEALGSAKSLTLETLWTHVHILIEETWDARFFWREPALAIGNPRLAAAAREVLDGVRQGLAGALDALAEAGVVKAGPEVREGLSRQMATGIAFHAVTLELTGEADTPRELVARAAAQVMLPLAGYAGP